MNNAILIPGADFSANALDTEVIVTPIPCTGLTISQSAADMTAIGSTLSLSVTKMPVNTTDAVVWSSSDTTVATVDAIGTVTQVGLGAATITAICGQQSASCAVTAVHTVNFDTNANVLTIKNAGIINDNDAMYGTGPKSGTNGWLEWASLVNETGGYKVAWQARSGSEFKTAYPEAFPCYAFKIPAGTVTISFSHPDVAPEKLFMYFIDSHTKSSKASSDAYAPEDTGKFVNGERYTVDNVSGSYLNVTLADVTQAVGADSFIPAWYDAQQSDATGWASGWTMTFSA